jgi:cytochrome c biogenesis protein CcdA
VLRLLGIVISIGLADSLNPTTIAPALYLASGERARGRVLEFTVAVFAVYLVGGLVIALGPGHLLIGLIPHPHHRAAYVIETIAGAMLLAGAALLWRHRGRLAEKSPPEFDPAGRSSWVLGVTITAIELPTAFPYFAAIASVVGADLDAASSALLILVFNVCFILPLLGILLTLTLAGDQAVPRLARGRTFLHDNWPIILSVVGLLVGAFVIVLGVTGFGSRHNDFGQFLHRVRHHLIHPLP